MDKGYCRPSNNPWASPIHLVPKLDKSDKYFMKHIENIVESLNGKRMFSKIDLLRAYHQIPMSEEDIPKTAVTTPFRVYEFTVMTFAYEKRRRPFKGSSMG